MGRALTRAISKPPVPSSRGTGSAGFRKLLGRMPGRWRACPPMASCSRQTCGRCRQRGRHSRLPRAGATIANVAIAAQRGLVHVIGTTVSRLPTMPLSRATSRAIVCQIRQHGLRRQPAGCAGEARPLNRWTTASTSRFWRCITRPRSTPPRARPPARRSRRRGPAESRLGSIRRRGRMAIPARAKSGDIGFASLRGGTVTGDHSVIFAGPYERIELSHRAEDRMISPWRTEGGDVGAWQEARTLFGWPTCSAPATSRDLNGNHENERPSSRARCVMARANGT